MTSADIHAPESQSTGLNNKLVRAMLEQVNKVNLPSFNIDASILRGLLMEFLRFTDTETKSEKDRIAYIQHMTLEFGYQAAADMVKGIRENPEAVGNTGDVRTVLTFLEREFRRAAEDNAVQTWGKA